MAFCSCSQVPLWSPRRYEMNMMPFVSVRHAAAPAEEPPLNWNMFGTSRLFGETPLFDMAASPGSMRPELVLRSGEPWANGPAYTAAVAACAALRHHPRRLRGLQLPRDHRRRFGPPELPC